MNVVVPPSVLDAAVQRWRAHPFYASSVVLGLDIGLEGIGVFVRRGPEILYAKTWQFDVPDASPLAERRAKRAWRHCRKNRAVRLRRLKRLFAAHGLPWPDDHPDILAKTNAFDARYRAATKSVGSPMALAIAIRHCVAHRGYDYTYFDDDGKYAWGSGETFAEVKKGLAKVWLTAQDAAKAIENINCFGWEETEKKGREKLDEIRRLIAAKTGGLEKLHERLAKHARERKNNLRPQAKGEAFARSVVWEHLELIVRNNASFIIDPERFLAALALRPETTETKSNSIFHYHRKTPEQMKEHFTRKEARCEYARLILGLGAKVPVASAADLTVRRFKLLEFLATRRFELATGEREHLSDHWIERLLDWQAAHPAANRSNDARIILEELDADLIKHYKPIKLAPQSRSAFNKEFWTTLRDLLAPSPSNRRGKASLSIEAARDLYERATADGLSREPVVQNLQYFYSFRRDPRADLYGTYPQVEFLLGERVRKDKTRSKKVRGDLAHSGRLQRLFEHLAEQHGISQYPDYAVVEVIRDAPRTKDQKDEFTKRRDHRRAERKDLFAHHGIADTGHRRERLCIKLFHQQRGICPFSGEPLGSDPLAGNLELEHLYPESWGGLTLDENLVLTFKATNASKGQCTPRQYAEKRGVAFDDMRRNTAGMKWNEAKREIFAWENPGKIPPFANTTRIAQLAAQLRKELGAWMQLSGDAIPQRIGLPGGFHTAACRTEWGFPKKDRGRLTHHLEDAALLAYIPPREGQNYVFMNGVACGGIFQPEYQPHKTRTILRVLPLGPAPVDIVRLTNDDAAECPIERRRPQTNKRRIYDTTFLRVLPDGTLACRECLPPKDEIASAETLRDMLLNSGIPQQPTVDEQGNQRDWIPANAALERWLRSEGDEPLRLARGTPIRSYWKPGGKGNLIASPLGFGAVGFSKYGKPIGVSAINSRAKSKWAALELWRGWDEAKGRWAYYKRLVPSRETLRALRSMGCNWKKKNKKSWRPGGPVSEKPLNQEWGGKLPPFARPAIDPSNHKPVRFRLGDTFCAALGADGKLSKRGKAVARREWITVTAVNQGDKTDYGPGRLELDSVVRKGVQVGRPASPDDLAYLAGLPPADDTSSYPTQRPLRSARPERAADFRLQQDCR